MISMRIKNVNPKGWYDIPGYDGIYQINYWADIRKKLGNGKYKYLKPYVKDCIGRMEPENARKYLSILLLESEVDVIRTCGEEIEIYMKEDEPQRKE